MRRYSDYPVEIFSQKDGKDYYYFIEFPDLPGCMGGSETVDQIPAMAEEVFELWCETMCYLGKEVPEPYSSWKEY